MLDARNPALQYHSAPTESPRDRVLDQFLKDPWNPTEADVRAWAFAAEEPWPDQDWNLALSWYGFESLCLELAADEACPKRRFFLGVLYLQIGDAVRTAFDVASRSDVERLLAAGDQTAHPDIVRWCERSRRLMADPNSFDYEDWCGGGLASESSN